MKPILLIFPAGFIFGCGSAPPGLGKDEVVTTQNVSNGDSENQTSVKFRLETAASNVEVPWAFAFLPNG
jgi:hypothetical protein